ncbi:ODF2 isoform 16, partial [Pan troglodytes]
MSASSSGGSPRFPSCGKNGVTSLTQKKVLRAPCGAPSVTVTKSHKRGMKGDTVNVRRSVRVKTKVKMQKGERQMAKRFLEERKEELEEVAHELAETEHENTVLRHNIERMKEEKDFTILQKKHLQQEKECLMSKLVEAEMDGAAAAKQVMALKDTIGKLKTEKQMTCTDINTLTRQKELLLQKLSTFEETNRTLRDLLREQHCKE